MNQQITRTLQQTRTSLAPDAVLDAARYFFSRRPGIYSAFIEQEGPTHVTLRGQGGEEIAIGVRVEGDVTAVTGSSYLFDQQVMRFFSTLPPAPPAGPVGDGESPAAAAESGAAGEGTAA
ncbi:MAG TPA: hypothetical protein VF048_10485 [Gemmatimonadaceae bacterium]|jgi:hypothetical protein